MWKFLKKKLLFCSILVCFLALTTNIFGQTSKATTFVNVSPNRFAPEFYGEVLSLKATLVNLPGASAAGSTWTLYYEVYFLPEGHATEVALKRGGRLGSETSAGDFPKRIFLGKGGFTKKNLKTLANRTAVSDNFKLRSMIPVSLQMENTKLLTVYTMKVYDANLKKTILKNGLFFGGVFVGNKQKREKMYLNFYISASGEVYVSQVEKEDDSTEWKMF